MILRTTLWVKQGRNMSSDLKERKKSDRERETETEREGEREREKEGRLQEGRALLKVT